MDADKKLVEHNKLILEQFSKQAVPFSKKVPAHSNEAAFKMAGAIALRAAAEKAQAVILEPQMSVEVDVPDECVGDVVGDLNGRRGRLQGMDPASPGKTRVRATVPMATMARYALDLRSITKGRGRFRQAVSHYEEMPFPEQQVLVAEYAKTRAAHESEH